MVGGSIPYVRWQLLHFSFACCEIARSGVPPGYRLQASLKIVKDRCNADADTASSESVSNCDINRGLTKLRSQYRSPEYIDGE